MYLKYLFYFILFYFIFFSYRLHNFAEVNRFQVRLSYFGVHVCLCLCVRLSLFCQEMTHTVTHILTDTNMPNLRGSYFFLFHSVSILQKDH